MEMINKKVIDGYVIETYSNGTICKYLTPLPIDLSEDATINILSDEQTEALEMQANIEYIACMLETMMI